MKMGICVLVALCEETEGLSFPTRSGYGLLKPQKDSPGNIFITLLPKYEISKNRLRRYLLKTYSTSDHACIMALLWRLLNKQYINLTHLSNKIVATPISPNRNNKNLLDVNKIS